MQIKDNLEAGLDDLDKLNDLYEKEYLTLEEWYRVKARIVDKMIKTLNNEKESE